MKFRFKFSSMQKLIIFSTIFLILSGRGVKYLFLKNIQPIFSNGNYFELTSIFFMIIFVLASLILIFSIVGFVKIIKRIYAAKQDIVVRERFAAFAWNCFWTFLVSLAIGVILKVIIWP